MIQVRSWRRSGTSQEQTLCFLALNTLLLPVKTIQSEFGYILAISRHCVTLQHTSLTET